MKEITSRNDVELLVKKFYEKADFIVTEMNDNNHKIIAKEILKNV